MSLRYRSKRAMLSLALLSSHYAFALAAPPITPSNSSIVDDLEGTMSQSLRNLTALPIQDPTFSQIPHTSTVVTFWNHILIRWRDEGLVSKILQQAIRDIIRTPRNLDEAMPLVPQIYQYYDNDSIKLYVLSAGHMTWREWFNTLGGLKDFVRNYEHVDTGFLVGRQGSTEILGLG